jgi:hypothetical protein
MTNAVLTVKDYPKHPVIGTFYYGFDQQVYLCDSYEHNAGFWMTNVLDHSLRKCVSGSAIDRTWHSAQNDWRRLSQDDVTDKEYLVVDTTVAPELLEAKTMMDKDVIGKSEWVALFVWYGDSTKFIRRVREAAAKVPFDSTKGRVLTTAA